MENNRRSYRAAAEVTRRPVQYGRTSAAELSAQPVQPVMSAATAPTPTVAVELQLHWPTFRRLRALWVRIITARRRKRLQQIFSSAYVRTTVIGMVLIVLAGQIYPLVQNRLAHHSYDLGSAASLLQPKDAFLGKSLVYSQKDGSYNYNQNYSPTGQDDAITEGGAVIKATANADASKGLTVTDPINQIDFKVSPQFPTLAAKQDANRLIYPLMDGTGWMVYTMQAGGVKEDVLLSHANGDTMTLKYTMDLSSQGLAARLQPDGSVGIYGSSEPIMGNVTTSDAKDAALLQKARQNAKKDKLLFSLPTPVVYQANNVVSKAAKTHYELNGDTIITVTTGLRHATFPLTVDPAVTVTSTADLFRDTTPESNIDLDASTGDIARGQVTGGMIPSWTTNANSYATARFMGGAAIYDDYVYAAGGAGDNSTVPLSSVEFAHINSGSPSIGTWSSTTSLPVGLVRFQLLAYNGYLYAIGGGTSTTDCNTASNVVYYIRIQSNGQLSGTWNNNTTTNSVSIPASLCGMGASIYNGKLYIAGGQTAKQYNSAVSTVYYASILPNGSVGSFSTSTVSLPIGLAGADMRIYNGFIYILGGVVSTGGGTTQNTVYYDAIASDGSVYGTSSSNWKTTNAFATARSNLGSNFTFAYDGYMYLEGGCNNFNGSFTCSSGSQLGDMQIAQINADGSLGTWANDSPAALSALVGSSLVSWRGSVYRMGGCTNMNTGAVSCITGNTLATQSYATISVPGQVGPLISTGMTNLSASLFGHGATVLNGYIYVAGGCVVNSCGGVGATTGQVYYAQINSDGTVGSWNADSGHPVGPANGLAYFGFTSYNGYLYATGGFTATGASTSADSSTIYYVKPNASTGALSSTWSTVSGMTARYGDAAVAYHGFLYIMGGCTGNTATSNVACTSWTTGNVVERYTLSAGVPGSLTTLATLPGSMAFMGVAFYNSYIYLTGGQTGSGTRTSAIYYVQVLSTGALNTSWNTSSYTMVHAMDYVDAYANNGYLYVTGGYDGTTIYNTIESAQLAMSSGGDLAGNMADTTTTQTARWGEHTVFANGFIYMLGGCTAGGAPASCSARSNLNEAVEQYYASNKGTSTWSAGATNYTTNRVGAASTAYNGYVYVAGGCSAYTVGANFGNATTFCTTPGTNNLNTISYAALNPDGSLGTWTTSGNNLTASNARAFGCLVQVGGYLYYAGGEDNAGNATNAVLYSQIGTNGAPGAWNTATGTLSLARRNLSCGVFNNHIYATGGINGTTDQATVDFSPDLSAGGNFSTSFTTSGTTALSTARANHATLVAGGYLYVLGGDDGTNPMSDVSYIQLSPSGGTTGSWANTTDLPYATSYLSAFAANGYVYVMGGRTAISTCTANTYIASVNSTGTLSNWNLGVNNFTTARFGATTSFYNGYYYYMGGDDCTSVISSNVIQQGGMRSQAMKGSFSKYADLNGDGRPEKLVIYLTNAQLNSVDIEKWSMTYKSARDAAGGTGWGVNTTVNPLVNQNAYQVFAYDGTGTDQIIARYYQITFTINQETSFTFVDTPSARPTIYQYGLHYAPPPSKRLMHGRDFRDQNQQGEDLKLGI